MHIYGPASLHGPQAVNGPHAPRPTQTGPTPKTTMASDELNISDAGLAASDSAGMVERARALPDVRQDRVDQIRAQIAAGTYETSEKLDGAVERLLDEIG